MKFENDEPKETVQAEKTEAGPGVLKFENDEIKETVQAETTEAGVLKFENDESKETVQAGKTEAGVLKFENDEPKETVQAETTKEPDELKDVTAKMAQLVVDAAERKLSLHLNHPSRNLQP